MKIHIAGQITGDAKYQAKFDRARKALERENCIVLNPAELPEGMRPADYMRICFAMTDCADAIAFLPDYTNSRGAKIEHALCQYVGKQTMHLEHTRFCVPERSEDHA